VNIRRFPSFTELLGGYHEFKKKQKELWDKGIYKGASVVLIVEPASTHASVTALWGSPIYHKYASTSGDLKAGAI
jgi:hypothetical protein